jgi:hypothetical protein
MDKEEKKTDSVKWEELARFQRKIAGMERRGRMSSRVTSSDGTSPSHRTASPASTPSSRS